MQATSAGWAYTKRTDGRIAISLDNNTWNFFFDLGLDLAIELPADRFAIFIPREIGIETLAIPNDARRAQLKAFIEKTIAGSGIITTYTFGFARKKPGPERYGGFGQGTFMSDTKRSYYRAIGPLYLIGRGEKASQLTGNEGDAAVGATSFSSIVLTCERPGKTGPIRFAAKHGGQVLYLQNLDLSSAPLRTWIEQHYDKIP